MFAPTEASTQPLHFNATELRLGRGNTEAPRHSAVQPTKKKKHTRIKTLIKLLARKVFQDKHTPNH